MCIRDRLDSISLPHLQECDESPAPPGGRTHAVRLLRRAFVAGDAHTFRDVLRALKQHVGHGTVSIREAVQAARRAKRIGAPGESITYAQTLIDRLKDDCERQYRLETRSTARALSSAAIDVTTNDNARLRQFPRKLPNSVGQQTANAQLSFDFPGSIPVSYTHLTLPTTPYV